MAKGSVAPAVLDAVVAAVETVAPEVEAAAESVIEGAEGDLRQLASDVRARAKASIQELLDALPDAPGNYFVGATRSELQTIIRRLDLFVSHA